jgi:hypothetical protein
VTIIYISCYSASSLIVRIPLLHIRYFVFCTNEPQVCKRHRKKKNKPRNCQFWKANDFQLCCCDHKEADGSRASKTMREREKTRDLVEILRVDISAFIIKIDFNEPYRFIHRCYYAREKNRKIVRARVIGTSTILTALLQWGGGFAFEKYCTLEILATICKLHHSSVRYDQRNPFQRNS